LVLLGTILIAAGLTSVSLANTETTWGRSYFDVVEASSGTAYFAIDTSCDDKDENCTVKVSGSLAAAYNLDTGNTALDTHPERWAAALNACTVTAASGDDRYESFESCWDLTTLGTGFTVTWPVINPDDDFEITPYCKRGDDVCAEELRVCFNAADCDDNDYERADWTRVGELWDEAGSCLHDGDEDDEDVWECIDKALDNWLDDHMGRNDDYDDLEDERESRRGFVLEDYERDLSQVGDQPYTPRYRPTPVPPAPPVYQPPSYQPSHPPAQPHYSGTLYLDAVYVNYGGYLDTAIGFGECNTEQGCIRVIGSGTGMSSHLGRVFIQITDPQTRSCLSAHGIPYSGPTVVEFDDPILQACDSRIATANGACPTRGIGVKEELLRMYNLGLLRGLLSPTHAQILRQEVNSARSQAADCLCRSGFSNRDFVSVAAGNPWDYNADARQPLLCRS
jgi:hypothetical protein